jgi:hypothetical protein
MSQNVAGMSVVEGPAHFRFIGVSSGDLKERILNIKNKIVSGR